MIKLRQLFTKNLGWKISSLAIAIMLWFIIINVEDPPDTQIYYNKIAIENSEQLSGYGLVIANQAELDSTLITLRIKGTRKTHDELNKNKDRIQVTADLETLLSANIDTTEPLKVPLSITVPDAMSVVYQNMSYLDVYVERLEENKVPIEINITGLPASGYFRTQGVAEPSEIIVAGPESIINKIAYASVNVQINGDTYDYFTIAEPILFMEDGTQLPEKDVANVTMSTDKIAVTIPIGMYMQIPVLTEVVIQGVPADGFTFAGVSVSPNYIEVIGPTEELDNTDTIVLPAINIEGRNETFSTSFDIRSQISGENVSIREGTPSSVTVTVQIVKEEVKIIEIYPTSVLVTGNDDTGMLVTLSYEPAILEIKGTLNLLEEVTVDSIHPSIDVSGYGTGTHSIPVLCELPEGITQTGTPPFMQVTIQTGSGEEAIPVDNQAGEEILDIETDE